MAVVTDRSHDPEPPHSTPPASLSLKHLQVRTYIQSWFIFLPLVIQLQLHEFVPQQVPTLLRPSFQDGIGVVGVARHGIIADVAQNVIDSAGVRRTQHVDVGAVLCQLAAEELDLARQQLSLLHQTTLLAQQLQDLWSTRDMLYTQQLSLLSRRMISAVGQETLYMHINSPCSGACGSMDKEQFIHPQLSLLSN